ncbi:hypothetical protein A6R68_22298, partial [Neotoma lepida]
MEFPESGLLRFKQQGTTELSIEKDKTSIMQFFHLRTQNVLFSRALRVSSAKWNEKFECSERIN